MEQSTALESAPRDLRTVEQFAELYPAWTQASLRSLILNAEERYDSRGRLVAGNGLAHAIFRDRRRVLISEGRFFAWIADQQRRFIREGRTSSARAGT
jgi:hypothetical protein